MPARSAASLPPAFGQAHSRRWTRETASPWFLARQQSKAKCSGASTNVPAGPVIRDSRGSTRHSPSLNCPCRSAASMTSTNR